MDSEQEFCLKWNNHQKTLVSVFDMLLESGTLVDCTLAAEGQYLKAHKVVLSACSPFFQMLLSQHSEQHPIVILKDVTFKELKAMIDYMYRGEVNVSQDQLEALLNAAESLQIKGLFDGREGKAMDKENPSESRANVTMVKETRPTPVDTMDEDSRSLSRRGSSREGSMSPAPRKRRKHRRRSSCGEEFVEGSALLNGHDQASSSSDRSQAAPIASQSVPVALCPVPVLLPLSAGNEIEKPIKHDCFLEQTTISQSTFPPKRESDEAEGLLIPKTECVDNDVGEGSVEDLTLDEDEDDVSMDRAQPGPSSMNEGPIQTYGPWRFDDVSLPVLGPTGSYSKTRVELCRSGAKVVDDMQTSGDCTDIGSGAPGRSADPTAAPSADSLPVHLSSFQCSNSMSDCTATKQFSIPLLPQSVPPPLQGRSIFSAAPEGKPTLQAARLESQIAMQEFKFVLPRPSLETGEVGDVEGSAGLCNTQPPDVREQNPENGPSVLVNGQSTTMCEAPEPDDDGLTTLTKENLDEQTMLIDQATPHNDSTSELLHGKSIVNGMTLVSHLKGSSSEARAEDVKTPLRDLVPLLPHPSCPTLEALRVKTEPNCEEREGSEKVAHTTENHVGESDVASRPPTSASNGPVHWSSLITASNHRLRSVSNIEDDDARTVKMEEYYGENGRRSAPCTQTTKSSREPVSQNLEVSSCLRASTSYRSQPSDPQKARWSEPLLSASKGRSELQRRGSEDASSVKGSSDRATGLDSSCQPKKRKSSTSQLTPDRSTKLTDVMQWLPCPRCKKKFMSDFNLYTHVQFFCHPTRKKF